MKDHFQQVRMRRSGMNKFFRLPSGLFWTLLWLDQDQDKTDDISVNVKFAEKNLSKRQVSRIRKGLGLRCHRRIKCNVFTEAHQVARVRRCELSSNVSQGSVNGNKYIFWMKGDSVFMHLYTGNMNAFMVLFGVKQTFRRIMCWWKLISNSHRSNATVRSPEMAKQSCGLLMARTPIKVQNKEKTVNQVVYWDEMCIQMFLDVNRVTDGDEWTCGMAQSQYSRFYWT